VIIFDNRRMAAISGLQKAQYGIDYATNDNVEVDYTAMAGAFKGVNVLFGGYTPKEFKSALENTHSYDGLSVIHLPVYCGKNELGGMGAFGRWNVGNWCEDVQKIRHDIGL
jgi:3D-(3,5/4)-trihydroxycyclohexane-1,2-dione acylhydrolase (decyclizing)